MDVIVLLILRYLHFILLFMTRDPIDWPISRESSASPNLLCDGATHPVCDHWHS